MSDKELLVCPRCDFQMSANSRSRLGRKMLRCKSCKRVFNYSEGRDRARASDSGLTEQEIETEIPEVETVEETETSSSALASFLVLMALIGLAVLAIGLIVWTELYDKQ